MLDADAETQRTHRATSATLSPSSLSSAACERLLDPRPALCPRHGHQPDARPSPRSSSTSRAPTIRVLGPPTGRSARSARNSAPAKHRRPGPHHRVHRGHRRAPVDPRRSRRGRQPPLRLNHRARRPHRGADQLPRAAVVQARFRGDADQPRNERGSIPRRASWTSVTPGRRRRHHPLPPADRRMRRRDARRGVPTQHRRHHSDSYQLTAEIATSYCAVVDGPAAASEGLG